MAKLLPAALLLLSACASVTVDPSATPAQIKAAKLQANFDQACAFMRNANGLAAPLLPVIKAKLGDTGVLAVTALQLAIADTCGKPLDLSKADEITQRLFDIGGDVLAAVAKAQQS